MRRPPSAQEMKATTIMTMRIDEASSKIRSGPPGDNEEDCCLPIWGGIIPVRMQVLDPVPDPRIIGGIDPPGPARNFRLG